MSPVRETDPPETVGSPSTTAATLTAPVRLRMTVPDQITEHRVVIRSLDDQRIVTVIEVLSPANKSTGSAGRESYIAKRNEILASGTHFVEIDLLREGGKRIPRVEHLPDSDYLICVSRDHQRPYADWWPLMLEQSLPEIPVPLRREDPDITIDVQAILHELYDRGAYSRRLDYSQPVPSPALSQTRQQWIEETVL